MEQTTINQRLKFLVEKFNLSSRAFSELIGESPNNTNNYIGSRQAEPRAGYLTKVLSHFSDINPAWLLTGKGEPFLTLPTENEPSTTNAKKIFRSQIVGDNNTGTATQGQGKRDVFISHTNSDTAHLQALVEQLRSQLADKDAVIAAKDETIQLLKAAIKQP